MTLGALYDSPVAAAQSMMGRGEVPDRAALQEFLSNGGANLDPATTAWCAAFVNASLGAAGGQGTGSNMAKSFLDWGQPVDQPQPGDVAVFSRGDPSGPYGHVGFFQGYGPDGQVQVLGGNQGDAVSVAGFDPSNLLGFRRAPGAQGGPAAPPPQMPGGTDIASVLAAQNPRQRRQEAAPDPRVAEVERRRALFEGLPGLYA